MIEGVEKMNIVVPIAWFIGYIVTHVAIGIILKNYKKIYELNPDKEDVRKNARIANLVFKWWPFIYVIIILVAFLGQ